MNQLALKRREKALGNEHALDVRPYLERKPQHAVETTRLRLRVKDHSNP